MPEVTYETVMNLSVDKIWDFVQDMNNWAPFLTGYQSHEIIDDRHSIWTLKGDLGMLSRTVRLDVNITEWNGPVSVQFRLDGLNEAVEGGGSFVMAPLKPARTGAEESAQDLTEVKKVARIGLFRRFLNWIFQKIFTRKFGTVERVEVKPEDLTPDASELSFTLRMDATGPMAPMINAMLGPAILPAAEDLGDKIAAHLETLHGVTIQNKSKNGEPHGEDEAAEASTDTTDDITNDIAGEAADDAEKVA